MENMERLFLQNEIDHNDGQGELTDDQIKRLLRRAELRLEDQIAQSPEPVMFTESFTPQSSYKFPQMKPGITAQPYVVSNHGVARADATRLLNCKDRKLSENTRVVGDPVRMKSRMAKEKAATAGPDWFNLPRTNLTPELKRDIQLLKMRSVLDSKRHYKKENIKARAPEHFQVGTLVEGPTEFFSSRLLNRDRKRSFIDEVLAAENSTGRFKSKYNDIQTSATSGKKVFYKTLKAKRSGRNNGR